MKIILIVSLVFLLSSCVKVDYQQYKMMSGGYKDESLGYGVYSISYEMYGQIDPNLVLERWHRRASELCENGYDVLELSPNKRSYGELDTSDKIYRGSVKCKN